MDGESGRGRMEARQKVDTMVGMRHRERWRKVEELMTRPGRVLTSLLAESRVMNGPSVRQVEMYGLG